MGFGKKRRGPGGGSESQPGEAPGLASGRVETYSGYRLHESPRRLIFNGEWLEVSRVLARWQEPAKLAFIVSATNSRRYLLEYHQQHDVWEIQVLPGSEPESE